MTEAIDVRDFETEDQRQESIAEWRIGRALSDAPELFIHARALTLSRPEAGETLPELNAPMKITTEDDASERYARLAEWVDYFAGTLNIAPPVVRLAARRVNGEVHGFRAHVTPEGAGLLVSLLTMWLRIHHEQLQADAAYPTYRDDVTEFLWELRKKYPLERGRERSVEARACPECADYGIQAEWWSENRGDVEVSCQICGHKIEPKDYTKFIRDILPEESKPTWADALPAVQRRCTGSTDCSSIEYIDKEGRIHPAHVHGCRADTGNCGHPEKHVYA
ncbi:MAG: hypothetical protein ABI067_17595 [Leifsonia sp.]